MIDIHCHLIYGINDGPGTLEDSLRMVHAAEKVGIKTIIATPHCRCFAANTDRALYNYDRLVYAAEQIGNVDIKMGYEISGAFNTCIIAGEKSLTLNNSRYMLVELPADNVLVDSIDALYSLQVKNIAPIIAHPERNKIFLTDFEIFSEFIKRGCYVQLDAASISGKNGRKQKRFARQLIKLKFAHFIASNAYCAEDYDNYVRALKIVRNWAGKEYADKQLDTNAKTILNNIAKSIYEMI